MDDRLQHQCAGFVQAEAEAFAEELQEREAEDSDDADTVRGSDSDQDSETPVKPVYKTKKPVKERKETTAVHRVERARDLASEYAFISVVSYFLRAIAPGAIDARHSAVLLAYHGRLGNQFDHCLSTVIGVLREEGMYKQNGALVEHVATEALRQVRLATLLSTVPIAHTSPHVVFHDVHGRTNRLGRGVRRSS